MDKVVNDYTVGKGRLYFRPFLPGTETVDKGGFRYFGNVPELTVSREEEKSDHFSSEGGINVKDASFSSSIDIAVSFTTDNISIANLAFWLGNTGIKTIVEAGAVGLKENFADIITNTFYQLGETAATPQGARGVTVTGVLKGVTALVAGTDYIVNEVTGLIQFLDTANLSDDDDVEVTYTIKAQTRQVALEGSEQLEGQMKFVSDNPKGKNKDFFWPRIQLSADGDYGLITEEWAQISFAAEVLQPSSGADRVYAEQR